MFSAVSIPAVILMTSQISSIYASHLSAGPAPSLLNERASYPGGWAFNPEDAGIICPSDASLKCGSTDYTSCCPAGQTCFGGRSSKYCCPTDDDCGKLMKSLPPNCADPSWDMFSNDGDNRNKDLFCCRQGKVGLKSENFAPGLCVDVDQSAAATKLASPVSQSGYTAVAPATATAKEEYAASTATNKNTATTDSASSPGGKKGSTSSGASGKFIGVAGSTVTGIVVAGIAWSVLFIGIF